MRRKSSSALLAAKWLTFAPHEHGPDVCDFLGDLGDLLGDLSDLLGDWPERL